MGDIIVMSYSVEENVNALKEHGLTVLENVLTTEEIDSYRGLILDYFKDGKNRCKGYGDGTQTIRPDAINVPYFESFLNLLDNKKIMDVLWAATDNKLRWVHHFDVHLNFAGAKGWHSDAQLWHIDDKEKGNFEHDHLQDDYNVYRIAIYFADHQDNQGGLFVRPGSHLNSHMTEEYYVGTEPGDIILFDARIKHMGGRYNGERPTVYAAIGKDNEQSKLHAEGAIDRQSKQNQQEYILQDYVKEKLDSLGIVY